MIGDKKGGGTTRILLRDSDAVRKFRETMGVDVKCLHILRNPFDNIATIAWRRRHGKIVRPGDLELSIAFYFQRLEANATFAASGECPVLHVRLEDLIEDSRTTLIRACEFRPVPTIWMRAPESSTRRPTAAALASSGRRPSPRADPRGDREAPVSRGVLFQELRDRVTNDK